MPTNAAALPTPTTACVTLLSELDPTEVAKLAAAYGATLVRVAALASIPGSYWGDLEAGLIADRIYARADTPAHSFLHELCHYVCMDQVRRAALATDAGGSDAEECGVCYLQILLADRLSGFGREKCIDDMNAWGYSFRDGSVEAWLAGDARFARDWLVRHALIDRGDCPTWRLRRSFESKNQEAAAIATS